MHMLHQCPLTLPTFRLVDDKMLRAMFWYVVAQNSRMSSITRLSFTVTVDGNIGQSGVKKKQTNQFAGVEWWLHVSFYVYRRIRCRLRRRRSRRHIQCAHKNVLKISSFSVFFYCYYYGCAENNNFAVAIAHTHSQTRKIELSANAKLQNDRNFIIDETIFGEYCRGV